MQKIILLGLLIALCIAAPSPPTLPNEFQQDFKEIQTLSTERLRTDGRFYYDAGSKEFLIHRDNGRLNKFCSDIHTGIDTDCDQLVTSEGDRYYIFPGLNSCCYCCNAGNGCGMLSRDWLHDAKFVGYVHERDQKYQNWDKQGGQDNFVWVTDNEQQIMRKLDQVPGSDINFDIASFRPAVEDRSVFNLPGYCKKTELCPGVCAYLRTL